MSRASRQQAMLPVSPVSPEHIQSEESWTGQKGVCHKTMAEAYINKDVLPFNPDFYNDRMVIKGADVDEEVVGAAAIGLIAPRLHVPVYRVGDRAFMRWVKGKTVSQSKHYKAPTDSMRYDLGCMVVADGMLGNSDRHSGNAMVAEDTGRLKAIDHGYCFKYKFLEVKNLEGWLFYNVTTIKDEHFRRGVLDTLDAVSEHAVELAILLTPYWKLWKCVQTGGDPDEAHLRRPLSADFIRKWVNEQRAHFLAQRDE